MKLSTARRQQAGVDDGAMVRALPTENPRQARGTECIRDDSILRVAECRMLIEAGAPASPASWSGPALRQKLASRLIRTWSGRLRVRAGQHGTARVPACILGHRNIQHTCATLSFRNTVQRIVAIRAGIDPQIGAVPTATRLPAELALASAASGPPTVMNICHTRRCAVFFVTVVTSPEPSKWFIFEGQWSKRVVSWRSTITNRAGGVILS